MPETLFKIVIKAGDDSVEMGRHTFYHLIECFGLKPPASVCLHHKTFLREIARLRRLLDKGHGYEFTRDEVTVQVKGQPYTMKAITVEDIQGALDKLECISNLAERNNLQLSY